MLSYNLFAVSFMARTGLEAEIENKLCTTFQKERCIAQGSLSDMHYHLNTPTPQTIYYFNVVLNAGLRRWHEGLAQVHTEAIQNMFSHRVGEGLQFDSKWIFENFVSCIIGKDS